MGSFERFKTKTHFNSLKRLIGITALAALAVKLLAVALATAAGGGTPLDLLARVPASLADLGAALLVFEVLRSRRPLQLAARPAILVAVSPVLFVASGIHRDRSRWPWPCCCWPCTCSSTGTRPWSPASPWPWPPGSSRWPCWPPRWPWPRSPPRAGCWPGRWTTGWPGGWPAPAGRWCWPWPCCRPSSGCADARCGSTPPSARSCSPPWPWARRGRRGTWSGRPCSATWATPAGPASTPWSPGPPCCGPRPGGGRPALARRRRPRNRVREVVDVGAGQPAVPGLSASSLGGLGGGQRPVALVSLRVALGLPDRGPEGRILVVATRTGPVGFLVDEVVRVLRYDPASCRPETTRLSGYVTAAFQALGASWLLIDRDAIRLPTGITAPR